MTGRRWRWTLVAGLVALALLAGQPLLRRDRALPCRPEMAVPEGLLAPVAEQAGQVHALTGSGASWRLSAPGGLSDAGIRTAAGRLPWRASNARALCAEGLPCAVRIESEERFALLWVEPAAEGFAGAMVVQDAPGRRLLLSAAPEPQAEGAACAALAAWVAFARTRLTPPR